VKRRRGFTLLEVMVATTIMAVAAGTLLSVLSTSLSNAARVTERDRATLEAKRILDELLLDPTAQGGALQGPIHPAAGVAGTWTAAVEPLEGGPPGPFAQRSERVVVRLAYRGGWRTRLLQLEGYRLVAAGPGAPQ
jgi:general secretion pathway protein I